MGVFFGFSVVFLIVVSFVFCLLDCFILLVGKLCLCFFSRSCVFGLSLVVG